MIQIAPTCPLTTGVDAVPGTAGNDTINGNATTFSSLDAINGGEGTDTLSIVDTAGAMSTAPTGVTLSSIEVMSLSTTGDLGVQNGGVTAVAQVDKVTFPTVTADVQQINQYVIGGSGSTDGNAGFTYAGTASIFAIDANAAATSAAAAVAAINSLAGSTVAFAGGTATITDVSTGTTVAVGSNVTASVKVGMTVSAGNGYSSTVTAVSYASSVTTITLAKTITAATGTTLTYGGGAGGVTVYGPADGSSVPFAITSNGSDVAITPSLVKAGVQGNEGTVVSFTYGGQSGQYTIGATNDATATNFAAALNAVASDATAAVAGSTGSKYVTLTADTAGTALGALVFSGAGSNTPTVTTTTANTVATAVSAAAYDVSGMTADAVNVVLADSANLKAAATSDVNVSGVTGAIVVDGGKNINVTDASTASDITIGATTVPKGTVVVNATKAGASSVAVDGGTDVTVNVTGSSGGADSITVGNGGAATDLPSGAIVVTSAHTGVAATNVALNGVTVKGGTSVTVTQTADASKVADDTTGQTLTQGAVSVTGGAATTSIEINQAAAATANAAVKAVAAKAATTKVTFTGLAAGEYITLTGDSNKSLTFTAAKALTAAEVAAAFANLVSGATAGSAPATNGVYTNGTSGSLAAGYTTGAVTTESATTASVTFSTTTDADSGTAGIQGQAITGTSSDSNGRVTVGTAVAGNAETLAETGKLGVVVGAVTVDGAITGTDVLSTVTLNGYGTATVDSDALTTLNLSNADAGLTATTASTGSITLNLNKVAGSSAAVNLDGGAATVTGVTINATGTKSDLTVTADAATAVSIAAEVDLDLTDSSFNAAKSITITGAGKVIIDEAGTSTALTVLEKIDASGNTGGVNVKDTLNAADQFIGGSGADTFALASSATKASSGGAGNDVITVVSFGTGGSVDAGEGTDTLVMTSSAAATADDSGDFAAKISGFEKLSLLTLANSANINAKNLGLNSNVIFNGTASSNGAATISGLAANATVAIAAGVDGSGSITLALDVATGTADSINLSTDVDGNLTVGKVIVANVETVNLSAVDKFVDVSGAYDEFGTAIGDGKDDTNSEQSITLDIDEAATLNITGSADLTVDILDTNNSGADIVTTLVDASTFTGKLTLIADGKLSGTTVKGGSGDDTLTADGDNDVLIGGAGKDKLTATALSMLRGYPFSSTSRISPACGWPRLRRSRVLSPWLAGAICRTAGPLILRFYG